VRLLLTFALICAPVVARARVVAVTFDHVIHPITVETISRALAQAERERADLLLIRLNTPGGLLESTRHIVEKIVASPIPVVTWVTPSGGRAASAGFLILQAGDIAVMAAGTNTGAASPVLLGGQMDEVMRKKAENDAAAFVRSIVAKRGRNAALAEKAVLEAKSFTDKEALDNKLIDMIASDEQQLFKQIDGREITRFDGSRAKVRLESPQAVEYRPSLREMIISAIADPNIAFILLILGALGLYVEFSHPGLILPGVAGAIFALLGMSALTVLPINWLGVALLILALALFALEAKFVSHGILGAGGAVAMVLGALLLVEGPPELRIRLSTAIAVTLPFALITIFLITLVIRARGSKVVTGDAGMVTELGIAHTALAPSGKVFVHGEYWDATATTPVEAGTHVRVIAVDGLMLKVEPLTRATQ
jgi:membrane-bound serine protease (ClpP class)